MSRGLTIDQWLLHCGANSDTKHVETWLRQRKMTHEGLLPLFSNDILCESGAPYQSFPGNIEFLSIVDSYKAAYKSKSRQDKNTLVRWIMVGMMSQGKTFWERREGTDLWLTANDKRVCDKIENRLKRKTVDRDTASDRQAVVESTLQATARDSIDTSAADLRQQSPFVRQPMMPQSTAGGTIGQSTTTTTALQRDPGVRVPKNKGSSPIIRWDPDSPSKPPARPPLGKSSLMPAAPMQSNNSSVERGINARESNPKPCSVMPQVIQPSTDTSPTTHSSDKALSECILLDSTGHFNYKHHPITRRFFQFVEKEIRSEYANCKSQSDRHYLLRGIIKTSVTLSGAKFMMWDEPGKKWTEPSLDKTERFLADWLGDQEKQLVRTQIVVGPTVAVSTLTLPTVQFDSDNEKLHPQNPAVNANGTDPQSDTDATMQPQRQLSARLETANSNPNPNQNPAIETRNTVSRESGDSGKNDNSSLPPVHRYPSNTTFERKMSEVLSGQSLPSSVGMPPWSRADQNNQTVGTDERNRSHPFDMERSPSDSTFAKKVSQVLAGQSIASSMASPPLHRGDDDVDSMDLASALVSFSSMVFHPSSTPSEQIQPDMPDARPAVRDGIQSPQQHQQQPKRQSLKSLSSHERRRRSPQLGERKPFSRPLPPSGTQSRQGSGSSDDDSMSMISRTSRHTDISLDPRQFPDEPVCPPGTGQEFKESWGVENMSIGTYDVS